VPFDQIVIERRFNLLSMISKNVPEWFSA